MKGINNGDHNDDLPICVAVPLTSGNYVKIKNAINEAVRWGAKFIEFRLDYYVRVVNLPQRFFELLANSSPVPLIFTVRSHREGGKREIPEQERIEMIKRLIEAGPAFIDIEASTELNYLEDVYSHARKKRVGIIYSYHDFKATPTYERALQIANGFIERCPGFKESYTENGGKADKDQAESSVKPVLKMIFKAKKREDNYVPLKLCKTLSSKGIRIVSFCMGSAGIYSRIFSINHGALFTFASMGEKTAPGQVKILKFKEIYSEGEENFAKKWGLTPP